MVDVQTISVVIAAASVVVGVVTFIMNSRKEARETSGISITSYAKKRGIV